MITYLDLKEIAKKEGRVMDDYIALSRSADPYFVGRPSFVKWGEWFAETWENFGFREGAHLRRVHYVIISQSTPLLKIDGVPYKNVDSDWRLLIRASLSARYLGLIPDGVLIDRRNPSPQEYSHAYKRDVDPVIETIGPTNGISVPYIFHAPSLSLEYFIQPQNVLVEVWVEKSTVDDVLDPLCRRLGVNLITGIGEMSETATRLAVERQQYAELPMRILYVSDFDPAGRSMPVAVARKIQYRLDQYEISTDIQIHPIVLMPEQCEEYRLPRTPLKETEKRKDSFEDRFGRGATELDALEALHPGVLARIVEENVCRWIDPTLGERVEEAEAKIKELMEETELRVRLRYGDQMREIMGKYRQLRAQADDINKEADALADVMERVLETSKPRVYADMIPAVRDPNPIDEPLYDSSRDYFEQLQHYRKWKGE